MFKEIKAITVQDLKQWQDNKKDFLLLDVRNPDEFKYANIEGTLIPMQKRKSCKGATRWRYKTNLPRKGKRNK